jgi:hypothetical protein
MFKVIWQRPTRRHGPSIIEGANHYPSYEAAAKQVAIWQHLFPDNRYRIEPIIK